MSRPDSHALRLRAKILAAVRGWFAAHGYLEMNTRTLVASPAMEPTLFALPVQEGFLRTSPEFALKRVLAEGLPRIYEIGPCFRDREHGAWHDREFTMLEWYRAGASLDDLIAEVQDLWATACRAVDARPPHTWQRDTISSLFLQHTGVDITTAGAAELSPQDPEDWDGAFFRRWVHDIEPKLTGAHIVERWPASQAALATVRAHASWPYACRFEVYVGGVELGNAFLELTDPEEQRRRFHASREVQERAGEQAHPLDEAFLEAVGRLPASAGIAMGFDRMVSVICGWKDIHRHRLALPDAGEQAD